jgi:hypothetical protein
MRSQVGKLGDHRSIRNKEPTPNKPEERPEEGTIYLDSSGRWYTAPKIDADLINKYRKNIYLKGALDRIQRLLFNKRLIIKALNRDGDVDPDLSTTLTKMADAPDVRLWYKLQRVWRNTAEWGPSIHNPVWEYVGNEYRLTKLNILPPESFSSPGGSYAAIRNTILPGIIFNTDTNELEFWQRQSAGKIRQLHNVTMVTDPLSGEFGGSPLVLPVIPIITMLDFAWGAQMQKVNLLGAGGRFFIKVTNPKKDDKAYAQKILRNLSKGTAYQLRENMEVVAPPISETSSAIETIGVLQNLIIDHFSPSSSIRKEGGLIGNNAIAEWQMYQAFISGSHAWLAEAAEMILSDYFAPNAFDGYSVQVEIPLPSLDRSEFLLKALDSAQTNGRITLAEARSMYMDLGLALSELTDAELAELESGNQDQMLQKAQLVVDAIASNDMDPEHLIDESAAKTILNKALGLHGKEDKT